MMHMITKEQYLTDPCGSASVPYWKVKSISVPKDMIILHGDEYRAGAYENYTEQAYFRLYHDLHNLPNPYLMEGFSVCKAEISEISEHINSCYTQIGTSADELQRYTKRAL